MFVPLVLLAVLAAQAPALQASNTDLAKLFDYDRSMPLDVRERRAARRMVRFSARSPMPR